MAHLLRLETLVGGARLLAGDLVAQEGLLVMLPSLEPCSLLLLLHKT